MKILLRPRLTPQHVAQRFVDDPLVSRALGPEPNAAVGWLFKKFFDASGPVLPRLLELAGDERMSFLCDLQATEAEVASAPRVEVACRVTIGMAPADSRATMAAYDADTLHDTASRWQVRLPRRIYLGKPVPPTTLAHVDQWTGEHVLGLQAAEALRSSGLRGYELLPLLHHRIGEPRPETGWHLSTRHLLPATADDPTLVETFDDGPREPSQPRRYGWLVYAPSALDAAPDFARTAEPWGPWRTPLWVVSQAVRRWYAEQGLRGWGFRPVLEQGSALHEEHSRRWAALRATLDGAGAELMI